MWTLNQSQPQAYSSLNCHGDSCVSSACKRPLWRSHHEPRPPPLAALLVRVLQSLLPKCDGSVQTAETTGQNEVWIYWSCRMCTTAQAFLCYYFTTPMYLWPVHHLPFSWLLVPARGEMRWYDSRELCVTIDTACTRWVVVVVVRRRKERSRLVPRLRHRPVMFIR